MTEPKGSVQPWERLLQITGVVAAVVAVFQQNNGVRLGAGLVAGVLLVLAGITAVRRALSRRLRLTRRERRLVTGYFASAVTEFLQELPLPSPDTDTLLAQKIVSQSAYVPVPYKAFSPGAYRTMPRQNFAEHPTDPVDMLLALLKDQHSAVVLGDPGSGKTLLAALTFARLADEYTRSHGRTTLPLFIRLNTMFIQDTAASSSSSLPDLLPSSPLKGLDAKVLDRLLDSGRACIILDGLDELPTTRAPRSTTTRMPEELVAILAKPTIVTCREAFHNLYVDSDRVAASLGIEIELLPLTYQGQIVPFVRQYSAARGGPELANLLLNITSQNESLAETLSRPLMLRMTMDVLYLEMINGDTRIAQRLLLTGSDYLNAQIYQEYVESWIRREARKDPQHSLHPHQKLALVEAIAWQIFRNPTRTDAGYGSFELLDLTIDRPTLVATVDGWLSEHSEPGRRFNRPAVITEIEERTFLIVSERRETYRFAHKSFFEYMVARHVYNELARHRAGTEQLLTLLSMPFPDEIIDFIRELLHWSKTPYETPARRHNVEQSLLDVLRAGRQSDASLMARQQAANLLPIVATPATREYLRDVVASDDHPFIRRAIAVGEALHHQDPTLLDAFVASLNTDERARTFHMGYNRIYYGDQPLSKTIFEDDGQPECTRFFRACIRHLRLDRYRYLRTMALATVRLLLENPARRALLLEQESEGLHWIRELCNRSDGELGPPYEQERLALAETIDRVAGRGDATTADNSAVVAASSRLDQGSLESRQHAADNRIPASDEQRGNTVQTNFGSINVENPGPGLPKDQE